MDWADNSRLTSTAAITTAPFTIICVYSETPIRFRPSSRMAMISTPITLGSLSIFTGIALNLLDGRAVEFTNYDFGDVAIAQTVPQVPNIALWALGAWLVVVLVSQRTRFGRYISSAVARRWREPPACRSTVSKAMPSVFRA
jgi:hypothetical protein